MSLSVQLCAQIVCDHCGVDSEGIVENVRFKPWRRKLKAAARAEGWVLSKTEDLCPMCVKFKEDATRGKVMSEPKYPAAMIIYWHGQETAACTRHADALTKLARFMGVSPPPSSPLPAPAECANCVNEAKANELKP